MIEGKMGIVIIIIAEAVFVLVVIVVLKKRNKKAENAMKAASVLYNYLELDNAIVGRDMRDRIRSRIFLSVEWEDHGHQQYVFDVESGVRIGCNPDRNHIALLDKSVSDEHCVLFLHGQDVYVQDLHSANGTWVRHWIKKKRVVTNHIVMDGDRLYVGNEKLTVHRIWYMP